MKLYRFIILVVAFSAFGIGNGFAQSDRQHIRQGNRLYRQQDYSKAEIAYRKALSANPENAQALYNLGCSLMMQQKDSAAVSMYEQAGKIEKSKMRRSKIYHNIGVVCQNHQMYGDAIKAYEESLRNNPADDQTRYNLALCKHLQKKQPNQNGQNGNKNNDKNKRDKKKQQQQGKQNKPENNSNAQEQLNKENAEQLLEAAIREEKATLQRLKKDMSKPQRKHLEKEW